MLIVFPSAGQGGPGIDDRGAEFPTGQEVDYLNERIDDAVAAGEAWPHDYVKTTTILFEGEGSVSFGKIHKSGDRAYVTFWVDGTGYHEVQYERRDDGAWLVREVLVEDEVEEAKTRRTGFYGSMSTVGLARFSLGSTLSTLDSFEFLVIEAVKGSSVEYEISPLNIIPLAFLGPGQDGGTESRAALYNFRSVANGLAWGLSALLAGAHVSDIPKVLESPWHYALFAPDFRVRVELVGNLNFLAGTRTDYLLYRTAATDRGIAFTPHIGLDISGGDFGESVGYGGLSISVGYRNWLNFDGDSYSGEPALLVALWGYPDTP